MNVLPVSLRNAIPAGIGLLIALVGLEWAGIIVDHPVTYVTLGDLHSAPVLLSLFGIGAIAILFALNVRGASLDRHPRLDHRWTAYWNGRISGHCCRSAFHCPDLFPASNPEHFRRTET